LFVIQQKSNKPIKLWFQDESRFGTRTISRRKITLKGLKPVGIKQDGYKNFYIYGAVSPKTGENFFIEFSTVDGVCFQSFLNSFSKKYTETTNVIILDNASFHKSKKIKIPNNIVLFFQPPYSPELNPTERVWLHLKNQMAWKTFKSLLSVKRLVYKLIRNIDNSKISSLTSYDYISNSFNQV